jgi:hypothetical protein
MPLLAQLCADIPIHDDIRRDRDLAALLNELREKYGEQVVSEGGGDISLYLEANVPCDGSNALEQFMQYARRLSAVAVRHGLRL